jgi:hypothetical protein
VVVDHCLTFATWEYSINRMSSYENYHIKFTNKPQIYGSLPFKLYIARVAQNIVTIMIVYITG